MALARARRDSGMNYWPGFVDALSTLVLSIIFLLSIFVIVQFYLTQEVTGKDTALSRLTAQIAQLTELLSLEKTGKLDLEEQLTLMRSSLARAEGERDRYKGLFEGTGSGEGKAAELSGQLDAERRLSAQPADRGAATPALRPRRSARCQRKARQRSAKSHRRSWPAAQRGARAAGARTFTIPFGFLRPTARHSRQST